MSDGVTSVSEGLSDERLVELYREGQSEVFADLIGRYRNELFHFLARFAGNKTTADDLFQETFLQVHLSIDKFDTTRRFRPWLFTIAANKARDQLRKDKRRRAASLSAPVDSGSDGGQSFVDLMESGLPSPEELVGQDDLRERVRQVVDELSEPMREVLLLAYFHRFAYAQIAEMLGIPIGTVKSRLHAAVGSFGKLWKSRYLDNS